MTKLSNWIIYTASYFPVAVFQVIRFIILIINDANDANNDSKQATIIDIIKAQDISQLIIMILSIIWIIDFIAFTFLTVKMKANERVYSRIKNNCLIDMVGFLGFYVLSILTIESDYLWIIINIIGYLIIGVFLTKSEKLYLCPSYLFLGYILYETENDHKILVRLSREKYNILLDDSANGIEAKQLTVSSHIVQIKK